jgi:hypothetical protein
MVDSVKDKEKWKSITVFSIFATLDCNFKTKYVYVFSNKEY